jgi:nitroimidazol reductase NimA-like FMN-containing flavoprotein (pyridoxamine 5'-phosphate oxidase superfamily)
MADILNASEIESFLKEQWILRIGAHNGEKVYVVPLSYVFYEGAFYCHSPEGMKIEMMRANPHVCVEVDEVLTTGKWISVIGWGRFEELKGEERSNAIRILIDNLPSVMPSYTKKQSPEWPFTTGSGEDVPGVIFRIQPDELTGRYETERTSPKIA